MKKIILIIVITMMLTSLATLTLIIKNIKIANVTDNNITLEVLNNEFIYSFEK